MQNGYGKCTLNTYVLVLLLLFFTINAHVSFAVEGISKHKLPISGSLDPCPHSVGSDDQKLYSLGPLEPDRDLDDPRMGLTLPARVNPAPGGGGAGHPTPFPAQASDPRYLREDLK